jgi:hypothetical protein
MCAPSPPKTPKVEQIPIRQPLLMPDGGDPGIAAGNRRGAGRRLSPSAMIFAGRTGLGAPSVTGPIGLPG